MVDPWAKQDPSVYNESPTFDFNLSYDRALGCAKRHHPRVKMIRKLSVDAAKDIPDLSLDWAWIDGNHMYHAVVEDLATWWPKVKVGGVFSGHDYPEPQIVKAVGEWMTANGKEFVTSDSSWWLVK